MIRHYYHVFADGQWRQAVDEHLEALHGITDPLQVTVGVIGSEKNRDKAIGHIFTGCPRVHHWVEAEKGWEQVTLQRLRDDLSTGHNDRILYAHTKGAYDPKPLNIEWRRAMTRLLVNGWENCLDLLGEYDAVGCHWLGPWDGHEHPNGFFGGNYWWANPSYLRTLPPLGTGTRWDAEWWIGVNNPRIHDLLPGWPSFASYARVA